MPVLKYNPFPETEDFPTGLRLFQDSLSRFFSEPSSSRPWTPAVDVYENENELVLKADLPEVDPKNVAIQIENGTLTLKGERRFEEHKNGKAYHRIERGYGSFVRAFSLADTIDAEHVKADYKNGVLTITLPKKEIAKPRTVNVEVSQ